jgi:hypothetical protein
LTATLVPTAGPAASERGLGWGLTAFVWLLPFHVLAMALLFGVLGLPAGEVRTVAAWKELLAAVLLVLVVWRAIAGPGLRLSPHWPDLAVGALGLVAVAYLVGEEVWFANDLPARAHLLGWRDTVYVTLLYFVGRASPEIARDDRYLRALVAVGVVTSVVAIVERLLVTPEMLVVLGAAGYIQDFLGLTVTTVHNAYGLPDNYWTMLGDRVVQRAGSTYLSSQGFAVPFLLILPAATLLLFRAERRRTLVWVAYATLWVALLLTVTRMTIVTCLAQVLVLAAMHRRWGLVVGWGLVSVVGLVAALVAAPNLAAFVWDTLSWQTGSSLAHLEDWGEGLGHLVEHPLGSGLGAGGLTAARAGLAPIAADSQYLKFAVDLGLPGLALYLAVLAGVLGASIRTFRSHYSGGARAVAALTGAAVVGLALNGITTVPLGTPFFAYVFFWLAGTTVTLAGEAAA